MSKETIRKVFNDGDGILQLTPTWVPRGFNEPGRRLRLHPDDYYALGMDRGGICERWLGSLAKALNGPKTGETEGMSYVLVDRASKSKELFKDFVDFDTFSKSDFRVVKVKECRAVKKSKKLLEFVLDDGSGTDRTILSGIHDNYEPEDLVGKTLVAITNLPARKMMGIDSCGMIISAVHAEAGEERLNLLMLDDSIPAGAKLY